MKETPIALSKDDFVLQRLGGRIDEQAAALEKYQEELEKTIREKSTIFFKEHLTPIWDDVKDHLEKNGQLPKAYNFDTHTLNMDKENNVYMKERDNDDDEHPLKKFLKGLMN